MASESSESEENEVTEETLKRKAEAAKEMMKKLDKGKLL